MRRVWKRKRQNIFYTIMTDVLFNLLAYYMLQIGGLQGQVGLLVEANGGLQHQNSMLTDENRGFKIRIGELNTENGGLKLTIADQGTQIGSMQEEIDQHAQFRSGSPLTVMFVIDITSSMGVPIKELRTGMENICEILPNRSKDCRVGILAFRKGVVSRYPITQILPDYKDNRESQESVLSFIDTLKPEAGWTEHKSVFLEAVKTLSRAHSTADPKRELIICFLGDVGPSELDDVVLGRPGTAKDFYSQAERETKEKILRGMQKWADMGNHSVMSLYAESKHTEADRSRAESKQWFQDLGSVSSKSAFYTDTMALLQAIHHAIGK